MRDAGDPSPWTQVPGFQKQYRLLDVLHLVHLGTLRDICASTLLDALEEGTLPAFYGIERGTYDDVLGAVSVHAHVWAKENGFELGIGTLNMSRLGRPNPRRPDWPFAILDSRIKAARCRALFAFITWLMTRLVDSRVLTTEAARKHAQVRAVCCWSLDTALSMWNLGTSVVVPGRDVAHASWLCRLHLACYQWIATQCLLARRLLYKVRPKSHYLAHLIDHHEQTRLSPIFLSTFGDEDFMNKARNVARSCHGKTFMVQWARRYALKRALQWREMKEQNGEI